MTRFEKKELKWERLEKKGTKMAKVGNKGTKKEGIKELGTSLDTSNSKVANYFPKKEPKNGENGGEPGTL